MKKRFSICISVILAIMISLSASAADLMSAPSDDLLDEVIVDEQVLGEPGAKEVFLEATWVSANNYEYRDLSGEVFAHRVEYEELEPGVIIDKAVDADVIASENATEVFLEPTQVDANTYEYYDENGTLMGTLVVGSEEEDSPASAATTRATSYRIDWDVPRGSYTHGSVDLDTTKTATEVYYKVIFVHTGRTFVGYYHTGSQTYYWFNPPSSSGLNGHFLCATSHKINFALKNDSNSPMTYIGAYSLSPLD